MREFNLETIASKDLMTLLKLLSASIWYRLYKIPMFFNTFVVKQTIVLIEICDKSQLRQLSLVLLNQIIIIYKKSSIPAMTPRGTYIFFHQCCQHNSRNFSNENQEYDDCILYRVKNISLYHKRNTRKYMKRSSYKRSLIYMSISK